MTEETVPKTAYNEVVNILKKENEEVKNLADKTRELNAKLGIQIRELHQAIRDANAGLKDYEGVSLIWAMGGASSEFLEKDGFKKSMELIKLITGEKE